MTIGTPAPRQDAAVKVTGAARYVGDLEAPGALEGVFVLSPVAAGRIRSIDLAAAQAVPGVVRIFGPGDLGDLGSIEHWAAGQRSIPLMDDEIRHEGQPMALVLAKRVLAEADFEVVTAQSGFECLDLFRKRPIRRTRPRKI